MLPTTIQRTLARLSDDPAPHDRPADNLRRADRLPGKVGSQDDAHRCQLRSETMHRPDPEYLATDGPNYALTSEKRAQCERASSDEDRPKRHCESVRLPGRDEPHRDQPNALLGIVRAMAQAQQYHREHLETLVSHVDARRRILTEEKHELQ